MDPAQYVLLKADVPPEWGWAPPEAKQEAQGTGIVMGGRQETQSWWKMNTEQDVLVPVTGPDGRKRQVVFTIVGTVLKSPEYAKMGWDRWVNSGRPPIGLPEGLIPVWREATPPDAYGEEALQGSVSGKPVGVLSFRYKAYVGHVAAGAHEFETPEVIAAAKGVARLLAAKITRAKLPVFHGLDVAILPDEWSFTPFRYGDKLGVETSADKQNIIAYVRNISDQSVAQEIQVQLWLGQPGYEGSQPIGDPVTIKNLAAHRFEQVNLVWPLTGNVEKARLYIQALPLTQEDVDPSNNATGVEVSIYYASNGSRAYGLPSDAYSFENWGVDGDELEEMVEGWLAALVGHMQSDPKIVSVMQRILFPQTFTRVRAYLDESAKAGAGGHCYGMSATSALYFLGGLQRPGGTATSGLSRPTASFNINIYHRAQMRTAMEAALTGENWHPREEGLQKTVDAVRASLRDERKPAVIEFFGQIPVPGKPNEFTYPGHAVLAYKLVDWGENQYVTYLYDSNFPLSKFTGKAMPYFNFRTDKGDWRFPGYFPYGWANSNWISAQPLTREITPGVLNDLVPKIKQTLADVAKMLESGNKLLAVLRCPADALITDEQGRATGVRGGKPVNEIPGSQALSRGAVEIYLLPSGRRYSVAVTRQGEGKVGFDLLYAATGGGVGVTTYDDLPASGAVKMSIAADGKTISAQAGGKALAPSLSGSFDGTKARWQSATTATTTSTTTPGTTTSSTTAGPSVLFDNTNAGGVLNRPTAATQFTLSGSHRLASVETYHWNHGRGGDAGPDPPAGGRRQGLRPVAGGGTPGGREGELHVAGHTRCRRAGRHLRGAGRRPRDLVLQPPVRRSRLREGAGAARPGEHDDHDGHHLAGDPERQQPSHDLHGPGRQQAGGPGNAVHAPGEGVRLHGVPGARRGYGTDLRVASGWAAGHEFKAGADRRRRLVVVQPDRRRGRPHPGGVQREHI